WNKLVMTESVEDLEKGFDIHDRTGALMHVDVSCSWAVQCLEQEREYWRRWVSAVQSVYQQQSLSRKDATGLIPAGLAALFEGSGERIAQVDAMSSMLA